MTHRRVFLILGAVLVSCAPDVVLAQVGNCDFLPSGNDEVSVTGEVTIIRRPRLACPDGVRISADSLRHLASANYFDLWGQLSFENADIRLQSRDAQYFQNEGRLTAQGNASLERKTDGSTVSGESLELLEQTEARPQQQLTATGGRPHALLHPERRESAPADTLPFEVYADRIVLRGQDMQANGSVEIQRDSLEGSADNMTYIGDTGQLVLTGSASLLTDAYDLAGGLLLLQMPDGELRSVTAREGGSLVSEQLTFEAPLIYFVLSEGQLQRLVGGRDAAWTPADSTLVKRPMAMSPDFTITGDSVDVEAPGGALENVVAIGDAHAESLASDLVVPEGTPVVARRDWIEGETITANFARIERDSAAPVPAPATDTTAAPEQKARLERLRARGGARAFYRMTADTARGADTDCLAFHYVTGEAITILMDDGSVTSTEVVGQVKGQHWEPPAGCKASGAPADSAAAPSPSTSPSAPSPASPTPPTPRPPPPPDPSKAPLTSVAGAPVVPVSRFRAGIP